MRSGRENTMSKKSGEVTISSENQEILPSSCQIVSDFRIDSSHFIVISTDDLSKVSEILAKNQRCNDYRSLILGHFSYCNKYYLIVNAKGIFEDLEPDIAGLLTERELQVVALIAVGWSNKQVAHQLGISEWTVSAHLRRIFIKLNVDSRAAMVYRCSFLIYRMQQIREKESVGSDSIRMTFDKSELE